LDERDFGYGTIHGDDRHVYVGVHGGIDAVDVDFRLFIAKYRFFFPDARLINANLK